MQEPKGIATDSSGNLWVVDRANERVMKYDSNGNFLMQFGSAGSGNGQFNDPRGIAISSNGTIWVTDMGNNNVQAFNASGQFIRKITGGDIPIPDPYGVATGPGGVVWISDITSDQLFEFNEDGTFIRMVPISGGNEAKSATGLATDVAGNVWLVDFMANRVQKYDSNGKFLMQFGSTGTGNGQLESPIGIAFAPSGNLLVTDSKSNRVQVFQPNGTYLRQFGSTGSGSGQLSTPVGIATGAGNTAFVVDSGNHRVAMWTHADLDNQSGVVSTEIKVDGQLVEPAYTPGCSTENCSIGPREWPLEASNYTAGQHTLEVVATDGVGLHSPSNPLTFEVHPSPPSLALSGSITEQGTLGSTRPRYTLQAEAAPNDQSGQFWPPTFLSAFAATGSGAGQVNGPRGVASDGKGHVWVVDRLNNRVEEFSEAGEYLGQFGSAGSGNGQFNNPWGIAVAPGGNLWVADTGNYRVQEFNPEGKFIQKFGTKAPAGSQGTELLEPEGIAVAPGGMLWITDCSGNRVAEFRETVSSESERFVRNAGGTSIKLPMGIAVDPTGNLWVAEEGSNHLLEFNPEGGFIRSVGSTGSGNGQLNSPAGVGIGPSGNVYVVDLGNNRVDVFNRSGEFITKFGTAGTGNGNFSEPRAIAFGAGGAIFISDKGNNRVHRWGSPWEGPPTFLSAFAATGSGAGQVNGPRGVASDGKGHVWVVDRLNNRVEEFSEAGEYLGQFGSAGSGNGQFNNPWGIAVAPGGNLWVADTGNYRVQEFNPEGKFIQKFGTKAPAGSQGTELLEPEGIAVAPGGMLWITDCSGNRVAEFRETVSSESERFVRNAGGTSIKLPMGIAVDPTGNLWVAEEGSNHLLEFNPEGGFIRSVGSTGSGNGQLNSPAGVGIGPSGNVYVVDLGNNRVDVFNRSGEFITKFGTAGTGNGNFSEPRAIAFGAGGAIFISDKGNNRVHRWGIAPTPDQIVNIEVKVDGKVVSTTPLGCAISNCTLGREWILKSAEYQGSHSVEVKATTASGWSTTKTLTAEAHPDATAPALESGGALMEAPEGWVEQKAYGFTATAKDTGYGVTSLALKIDGQQVASTNQACTDGGCPETLGKSVDMSSYSGGAHAAELIATDGAGTVAKKAWTINVDPKGTVPVPEAVDTLEAAEETSPINVVGEPEEEEEYEGTAAGLGIEKSSGELIATGTEVPTTIASAPDDGVTMEGLSKGTLTTNCAIEKEEEKETDFEPGEPFESCMAPAELQEAGELTPLEVTPVQTAGVATENQIIGGISTVAADTASHVDTITRPLYDGGMIFQDIRDSSGPEVFSWEVQLEPDQELKAIDSTHAVVYYEGEHPAFGITAVPAHDAVGTNVSTKLTVSEDKILTLTVEHHKAAEEGHPFVYPIIGGAGWEGGFQTYHVEMPPPTPIAGEEEEWEELGVAVDENHPYVEVSIGGQGPPVAHTSMSGSLFSHRYKFSECRYQLKGDVPEVPTPEEKREWLVEIEGNCMQEEGREHLFAGLSLNGWYWYKPKKEIWTNASEEECDKWGPYKPAKVNCEAIPRRDPHHVVLYGNYRFAPGTLANITQASECDTLWAVLTVEAPHKHEREHIYSWADPGDPCDWPQR
jgi:DNA-binding beta-propeller fold protein YncE